MKIQLLFVSLFCCIAASYGVKPESQTGNKVYTIHQTQREFVKKENRPYLKKKTNKPQNKNEKTQTPPKK